MFNFFTTLSLKLGLEMGVLLLVSLLHPQEYKCLPRSCQEVIFQLKNLVHLVNFKV
jgi:hypothetical protein